MKPILVIGSTLLDIGGRYPKESSSIHKHGTVEYTVGGAAFNIAANLHSNNYKVALMTYLKEKSLGCEIIRRVLERSGLGTNLTFSSEAMGEPAYVAHFRERALESGVTSSLIDKVDFSNYTQEIEEAIKNSSLVVVETNLSREQIRFISKHCKNHGKQLLAHVVAADRAKEILRINQNERHHLFEVVSMNKEEAKRLGFEWPATKEAIKDFCRNVNAAYVVVTLAESGYVVLHNDGIATHEPSSVQAGQFINDSGAGDALFSAICSGVLEGIKPDNDSIKQRITDWVSRVMQRSGANLLDVSLLYEEKQPQNHQLIAASCLLALGIIAAVASVHTDSNLVFWCAFFASGILFGSTGSLARETRLLKGTLKRNSFAEVIFCGAVAGLSAALFFFLPHVTGSTNPQESINIGKIKHVALWIIPASISAGLALDSFLLDMKSRFAAESERHSR